MSQVMDEIDVRTIAPQQRHAVLFDRFDHMLPGEAFVLVNDHNPIPLRRQLEGRTPGEVQWTYLQEGPDLWRVQIGRQERDEEAGNCCGGCGGTGH